MHAEFNLWLLEESSTVDYQEHDPTMKLLRHKSLTKGMVARNYNKIIEGMNRILSIGEILTIQGYQNYLLMQAL